MKKCKRGDRDTELASEHAERGSGVCISEVQFHLKGKELGTKEIEQSVAEELGPHAEQQQTP
jgi:hypothetical protein